MDIVKFILIGLGILIYVGLMMAVPIAMMLWNRQCDKWDAAFKKWNDAINRGGAGGVDELRNAMRKENK